jgi:hypothetical protein
MSMSIETATDAALLRVLLIVLCATEQPLVRSPGDRSSSGGG